ncbi:MAG TPA: transposase [Streptosporangiaceae bacterium]|nr:transposase [Streptosporangiaceae bacterium]
MGYNFRPIERDQQYLMPVSLRDWLPPDELAWFVLDAVGEMELGPIYARYRADGWGAPAFDPAMMTALLLYAYATGERSSRRIEARCRRDIAYRVITANQTPDHATIARFRADHEGALGELFGAVLRLCAAAGLGRLGLVAIDGTKLAADASPDANRGAAALDEEIARILAEAAAVDAAEDERYGEARGDELPSELADRRSRLARLREARRQLALADAERARRVEDQRTTQAGRKARHEYAGRTVKPDAEHRGRWAERNTTDPDSRMMVGGGGWVQGYNAQAAVAEDGLILAAELSQAPGDSGELVPLVEATKANLRAAGAMGRIGTLLADTGYWSQANFEAVETIGRTRLLIPPRRGPRPGSLHPPKPAAELMRSRLARAPDRARYDRRSAIVEPVFGQIKENRGIRRFRRRGLPACTSEWRLICATHNLLKLWRSGHRHGPTPPPPRTRRRILRERGSSGHPG